MNDEDSAELSDLLLSFIRKYTLEEVTKVIDDTYFIFDPRKNSDILTRKKENSEKSE